MSNAKPCSTPLPAKLQLSKSDGPPLSDPTLYQSIVGSLQYTTITRSDIAFAVNKVAQFLARH
jgi:hypothetical protein